jgi:hypothetical protein
MSSTSSRQIDKVKRIQTTEVFIGSRPDMFVKLKLCDQSRLGHSIFQVTRTDLEYYNCKVRENSGTICLC